MDQQKIGAFLKELRKGKGITQAELAEMLGVSNRTVSRWETGTNMPDFDVLIEMADFYCVDIREILKGESDNTAMDEERKEDLLMVADYTNKEKLALSSGMRCLFIVGLLAVIAFLILRSLNSSEFIQSFLLGSITGIMLTGTLYTSRHMQKIREFKLRLLNKVKNKEDTENE